MDSVDNAKLRMHIVPVDGNVELILASGRSPARPADWEMTYLFVRRTGKSPLQSRFLTVIDPVSGSKCAVSRTEIVSRNPLILKVQHTHGEDSITIDARVEKSSGKNPRNIGITLTRAQKIYKIGSAYIRGSVTECNYPESKITIEGSGTDRIPPGSHIRIYTENRSSMYEVLQVTQLGKNKAVLILKNHHLMHDIELTTVLDGTVFTKTSLRSIDKLTSSRKPANWRPLYRDAVLMSEKGKPYVVEEIISSQIFLRDIKSDKELFPFFTDENKDGRVTAVMYDYGAGARFEIALAEGE